MYLSRSVRYAFPIRSVRHSGCCTVCPERSDIGLVIIGLVIGEALPAGGDSLIIFLPGFVACGLSIYFYIYAQRNLGAAKTSAYYAVAPFIGAMLSLVIFREIPGVLFFAALVIMIAGTWMINRDQA